MIHAPRIVAARSNLVPASVLCALALCALASAAVPAAAVSATGPQAAPSSTHAAAGNGRIIFSRGTGGDYDVWAIDPGGGGMVNLTPGLPTNQLSPSIDPTGTRIAFRNGDGTAATPFDIWSTRLDTGISVPITSDPPSDTAPSYSPDGRLIAFTRDLDLGAGSDTDLMLIGADGSGLRNVTNSPGIDERMPEFSPDGTRLVFTVFGGAADDSLAVIGVDGSGRAPLGVSALLPGDEGGAVFSPDGKRIAFSSGPMDQLFVAAADGSNALNLTPTWPNEAVNASWAPDGSRLVWDDDGGDLFLISSSGGPITPLTDDAEGDFTTDWEHVFVCAGRRATIVGDDGPDRIKGTKKGDVIVTNAGKDIVRGRGGNDRICGGRGKDELRGNNGRDRLFGQAGADLLAGGRAADALRGGKGKDTERQ